MNKVDYDPKKFDIDEYGNLTENTPDNEYRGFVIEQKIGHVKVWDSSDNFVGEYPNAELARTAIDSF